jgi:hypothetical protein
MVEWNGPSSRLSHSDAYVRRPIARTVDLFPSLSGSMPLQKIIEFRILLDNLPTSPVRTVSTTAHFAVLLKRPQRYTISVASDPLVFSASVVVVVYTSSDPVCVCVKERGWNYFVLVCICRFLSKARDTQDKDRRISINLCILFDRDPKDGERFPALFS